jgi:hypothetical protein
MPRNLSVAIQQAAARDNCHFAHLFTFTVADTTYRYSEGQVGYLGDIYQPGLKLKSAIRYSEQLQVDPVVVSLQNITLDTATLLRALSPGLQGQEATVSRLYLQASEALLLFRGRISLIEIDQYEAVFTLITEFDPVATSIPTRQYSALCNWAFADSGCGYVANEDLLDPQTALPFVSCPKDFFSCEQRGRQHRFSGFIHLTREVSELTS